VVYPSFSFSLKHTPTNKSRKDQNISDSKNPAKINPKQTNKQKRKEKQTKKTCYNNKQKTSGAACRSRG
jgi:hypothetical protein